MTHDVYKKMLSTSLLKYWNPKVLRENLK